MASAFLNNFGGGMRCGGEIRADGVAPVPVADAHQHSQNGGPNTRSPHQNYAGIPAVEPGVQSGNGTAVQPAVDPRVQTGSDTAVQCAVDPRVHPENDTAVHCAVEPRVQRNDPAECVSREAGNHQPKNAPEVQEPGGFLRAGAASPKLRSEAKQPSLDYIESNRNKNSLENRLRLGRKRFCGAYTVAGNLKDGRTVYRRVGCKTWGCSYCGPRKAKRYRYTIRATAERRRLNRFLTLTLDPKKIEGDPIRYLRDIFNKFRTYLKRKFGVSVTFIAVLEFQKNGNPHLHLL